MRLHRIYFPFSAQVNEHVTIDNDKAHYLRNVLRIKHNANLRIFNHKNDEFLALVTAVNKKNIEILLQQKIIGTPTSKLDITLIQGLSKGDRMDYTVQKATELGINAILPIISEYCEVKLNHKRQEKKRQHWQNIAISACEQSFRTDVPQVLAPISLHEYCQSQRRGLLLEPQEQYSIHDIAQHQWSTFDVAVGPEGGWSKDDLKHLKTCGLTSIQFGQRILRTETVAPAILAAVHTLWGDFV